MPARLGTSMIALATAQAITLSAASTLASHGAPMAEPPQSLRETGLYVARSANQVHPDNLPFTPQYPLWSDAADKRRWLNLPPGTWIDAPRPVPWRATESFSDATPCLTSPPGGPSVAG